jgi:hypothetical protein
VRTNSAAAAAPAEGAYPTTRVHVGPLEAVVAETEGGRWYGTICDHGQAIWVSAPASTRSEAERRTAIVRDAIVYCRGLEAPR